MHQLGLLRRFREFYAVLHRLRRQLAGLGDGEPAAADELHERLRVLLEDQALVYHEMGDTIVYQTYRDAQYVMCALADEMLLHTDWAGRARWKELLLERALFGTHGAGEKLFERMDAMLRDRNPAHRELATVYLAALSLGFRGKLRASEATEALRSYRIRLYTLAFGTAPEADPDAKDPLLPQAYENVLDEVVAAPLPDLRPLGILLAVVFTVVGIALNLDWWWSVRDLRAQTTAIRERGGAEALVDPVSAVWNGWEVLAVAGLASALVAVAYVIYRRRAEQKRRARERDTEGPLSVRELQASFKRGLKYLHDNVSDPELRQQVPLFLMVGGQDCGKTELLRDVDLRRALVGPEDPTDARPGAHWWFFDESVVLDIAEDYVVPKDGRRSEQWTALLRQLRSHRPTRSFNGVLLTLPLELFYGPNRPGDAALRDVALRIYDRLREAQAISGLRYPIYVVVTRTEQLPGFHGFGRELRPLERQSIFGWSNPAQLDSTFQPEWLDAALDSVEQGVTAAQCRVFARRDEVPDVDAAFLFPARLLELVRPLRQFLSQILSPTVYHDSFFFRGLYFVGQGAHLAPPVDVEVQVEDEAPEDEAREPAAPTSTGAPWYLRDLLSARVFKEIGLARPSSRIIAQLRWQQPALLAAIAGTIVIGTTLGAVFHQRWTESRDNLLGTLLQFQEGIGPSVQKSSASGGMLDQKVQTLLRGMADLSTDQMDHWYLPISWFNGIDDEVRDAIVVVWGEVLGVMHQELTTRSEAIWFPRPSAPEELRTVEAMTDMTAWKELVDWQQRISAFEYNCIQYNHLAAPGQGGDDADLKEFGELVKYLYGHDVSESFYTDSRYYQEALGRAVAPPCEALRSPIFVEKVHNETWTRLNALYARLLDNNSALLELEAAQRRMTRLGDSDILRTQELEILRGLSGSITAAQRSIESQPWLARTEFAPNDELFVVLKQLGALRPLQVQPDGTGAYDFAEAAKAEGQSRFDALRAKLRGLTYDGFGAFVEVADDKPVELSMMLKKFRDNLDVFLSHDDQKLNDQNIESLGIPRRSGYIVRWDQDTLDQAVELVHFHQTFISRGLGLFPSSMRDSIRDIAKGSVEVDLLALLAQARRLEPSSYDDPKTSLGIELGDFQAASPDLLMILEFLNDEELSASHRVLLAVIGDQTGGMLQDLDDALNTEDLYSARFGGWPCEGQQVSQVFGALDGSGVRSFLDAQRDEIRVLSSRAQPLVAVYRKYPSLKRGAAGRLADRWEEIALELERYDQRSTDSALIALENFVLSDLGDVRPNYYEQLSPTALPRVTRGDFFRGRLGALANGAYEQCRNMKVVAAVQAWARLQQAFNRDLSRRFPFTSDVGAQKAVDPAELSDFIRLYRAVMDTHAEVIQREAPDEVQHFVEQMEAVASFLEPFIAPPGGGDDWLFTVEADFRVNQANEVGGNQIVAWRLQVGEDDVEAGGPPGELGWQPNTPIQLTLRWAKDSPRVPTRPDALRATVEDREVTYAFDSTWALLRLLDAYASPSTEFTNFRDTHPNTLRFVIPTEPASTDYRGPVKVPDTKVFIRVRVTAPSGDTDLVYPGSYPTAAPTWVDTKGLP
ncbi:MAG: DotU family type IV/VI secretion system protein [Alphaproteobacteria bacterium]|nr:DotU family type IV/VI secretion system protein [Alphaproteobacteria bacterium]